MLRRARGAAVVLRRLAGSGTGFERNDPAPLARAAFSRSFLDFGKVGNQEAIEKEKARLKDEMSRGYFADIAEIRKNSGKIAAASKVIIPEIDAVKFPDLSVESPDGGSLRLPLVAPSPEGDDHEAGSAAVPDVSLVCLSFRASSQKMTESWSLPFLDAFGAAKNIPVYEVQHYYLADIIMSLIGKVNNSVAIPMFMNPVKRVFLKVMKKSNNPQRHVVYAFGDHYDFRKKLQILNLLTGYIYLIDRLGRIRWQGFGSATQEELSSLTACTSILLDEK